MCVCTDEQTNKSEFEITPPGNKARVPGGACRALRKNKDHNENETTAYVGKIVEVKYVFSIITVDSLEACTVQ